MIPISQQQQLFNSIDNSHSLARTRKEILLELGGSSKGFELNGKKKEMEKQNLI
jgi:hypothetical protein